MLFILFSLFFFSVCFILDCSIAVSSTTLIFSSAVSNLLILYRHYMIFISEIVFCLFVFWDRDFTLDAQAEVQRCDLGSLHPLFPGFPFFTALASWVAGITCRCHHTQLIFLCFLLDMGFHHVGQAGSNFLTLGNLPTLASQSARIADMNHCAWPHYWYFCGNPLVYPSSEGIEHPQFNGKAFKRLSHREEKYLGFLF